MLNELIPCAKSPPPITSTVTWKSGHYEQSCYIVRYRVIGGIPCAYIGHLFDGGEVDKCRGVSIVPVSQLFVSADEIHFMCNEGIIH